MAVVLLGLFVIFVAIVLVIVGTAGYTASKDRRIAVRQIAADDRLKELREESRTLLVTGEPLICLGCNKRFPGPMPETGCPDCQISSLVVAERTMKGSETVELRGESDR